MNKSLTEDRGKTLNCSCKLGDKKSCDWLLKNKTSFHIEIIYKNTKVNINTIRKEILLKVSTKSICFMNL